MTIHFMTNDLLPLCNGKNADGGFSTSPALDEVDCTDCLRRYERRLALGKVAYEAFAEQRIAAAQGKPVSMPPWQAPTSTAFQLSTTPPLPDAEHEIWAKVAEAVAAVIPFVITDEVCTAAEVAEDAAPGFVRDQTAAAIRAAALAAGFRVEER